MCLKKKKKYNIYNAQSDVKYKRTDKKYLKWSRRLYLGK